MFTRKSKRLKVLDRYLILCEGEVTEGLYLNGIRKQKRIPGSVVEVREGLGVPMTLVRHAIRIKADNVKEGKRDSSVLYKEIWFVFDRDEHPYVSQAITAAKANGIKVAFSNPCFELFLILHFREYTRNEHRSKVSKDLAKFLVGYDKYFDYKHVVAESRYLQAKYRCMAINKASQVVEGIQAAPFCDVYCLIDKLSSLDSSPYCVG